MLYPRDDMSCVEKYEKLQEPCPTRCMDAKTLDFNMMISHNGGPIFRYRLPILNQVEDKDKFRTNFIRHGHIVMSSIMAKDCKSFLTLNRKNVGMDHSLTWSYKYNTHDALQK